MKLETPRFYTFSFHNPERAARMAARFAKIGLPLTFNPAVELDDPRIPNDLDRSEARVWSIMWGHLDVLRAFVEKADDNIQYVVVCEDDVYIRRDLPRLLPLLTGACMSYGLDVLIMGYLQPYPPVEVRLRERFSPIPDVPQLSFLNYHDEIWGAQMYMMSKAHARDTLNYFTEDYAKRSRIPGSGCAPFAADWTLTKRGRRALVYPMIAVEESQPHAFSGGHHEFHKRCRDANYDPAIHE